MPLGYSAGQLLRYHAWCVAHPDGRVIPPGGRYGWDDMTAKRWLSWFRGCLMERCSRGLPAVGKGNRAAKRAWEVLKAAVRCRECGGSVGPRANPNCSHSYCDGCRRLI